MRRFVVCGELLIAVLAVAWSGTGHANLVFSDDITDSEPTVTTSTSSSPHSQSSEAKIVQDYGKLPLHFEANQGQTDDQVKFLSRGRSYSLFLTPTEAVLALLQHPASSIDDDESDQTTPGNVIRMQLVGANRAPKIVGIEKLRGKSNYFMGNDPSEWVTGAPTYARVKYLDVYPGLDLVYYGNQQQLEFDFIVAPGADPTAITLAFQGADKLEVDIRGDLILDMAGGHLRVHKPVIYQPLSMVMRRSRAFSMASMQPRSMCSCSSTSFATMILVVD